jgi:hypothetical protein
MEVAICIITCRLGGNKPKFTTIFYGNSMLPFAESVTCGGDGRGLVAVFLWLSKILCFRKSIYYCRTMLKWVKS